jgi:hypothetical protein
LGNILTDADEAFEEGFGRPGVRGVLKFCFMRKDSALTIMSPAFRSNREMLLIALAGLSLGGHRRSGKRRDYGRLDQNIVRTKHSKRRLAGASNIAPDDPSGRMTSKLVNP